MSAEFRVPPEMEAGCQHRGRMYQPGEVFEWRPLKDKKGKPVPGDNPSLMLLAANDEAFDLQMAVWKAKVKAIKAKNGKLKEENQILEPEKPLEPVAVADAADEAGETPTLEQDLTDAGVDVHRAADSM